MGLGLSTAPWDFRQGFLVPWEAANPLSVSLFLTLCLPVCSALSLCLRLGVGSLTKPFTSSRTPMSSAMCRCLLQDPGSWLLVPQPPVKGKGFWGGLSGSGEVPEHLQGLEAQEESGALGIAPVGLAVGFGAFWGQPRGWRVLSSGNQGRAGFSEGGEGLLGRGCAADSPQHLRRASEEAFLKESKEESPGSEWEKVAQLCDFNPKSSKQSKDVSRMRSVLISLKQTPLSR